MNPFIEEEILRELQAIRMLVEKESKYEVITRIINEHEGTTVQEVRKKRKD